jgi:hypothetical protein
MITQDSRLKCDLCGRLMSFKESYYEWVPYGNSNDLEPPDEEHSHVKCYENWGKGLIQRTSWIKPYLINNLKWERKQKLQKLNEL